MLVVIKTRTELYDAVAGAIRARHPYEIPEILALRVERGCPPTSAGSTRSPRRRAVGPRAPAVEQGRRPVAVEGQAGLAEVLTEGGEHDAAADRLGQRARARFMASATSGWTSTTW